MFMTRHLAEWLENRIDSGAKVFYDELPDTGRVIFIQLSSGAGYAMEGIQDNITFTIESRGADRNFDDAEYIAWDADRTILKYGDQPHEFADGEYLYFVGRIGGPPTQIQVADTAGRYVFTCNYYCTVATNI